MSTQKTDYHSEYDEYWSRSDRWNTNSFLNSQEIIHEIRSTCTTSKLLDIGCGMGTLVHEFLALGSDAYGLDASTHTVQHGNSIAPGRFVHGSITSLPFEDAFFDTVISTDCLEHIATDDVLAALREMQRVTKRYVYVRLSTAPDRDGRWHLTVQPSEWWEEQFFKAGFRRHPLSQRVNAYQDIYLNQHWQRTLLFEKVERPESTETKDFLLQSTLESHTPAACYQWATNYIASEDKVIVDNCQSGAGAAIVYDSVPKLNVVALFQDAKQYSHNTYAFKRPNLQFYQRQTPPDLSSTNSAYLSVETPLDAEKSLAAIKDASKLLKPGGRTVLAVERTSFEIVQSSVLETEQDNWIFDCAFFHNPGVAKGFNRTAPEITELSAATAPAECDFVLLSLVKSPQSDEQHLTAALKRPQPPSVNSGLVKFAQTNFSSSPIILELLAFRYLTDKQQSAVQLDPLIDHIEQLVDSKPYPDLKTLLSRLYRFKGKLVASELTNLEVSRAGLATVYSKWKKGATEKSIDDWIEISKQQKRYRNFYYNLNLQTSEQLEAARQELRETRERAPQLTQSIRETLIFAVQTTAPRPILLWGAGRGGQIVIDALNEFDSQIQGFIDKRAEPENPDTFCGKPVLSPNSLRAATSKPFIIVSSNHSAEICKTLESYGYSKGKDYLATIIQLGELE